MQQRYRRVREPREARPGVTRVFARGLGRCCSSRPRTWPVIGLVAFLTQCQVSGDAKASRHDAVHEPILSPMRVAELIPIFYPPVDVDRSPTVENGIYFRRTKRDVRVASDSPHTGILWRQHGSRGERASIKRWQVANQRKLSNEHGGQVHNVVRRGAPEVLEMQYGEWPLIRVGHASIRKSGLEARLDWAGH